MAYFKDSFLKEPKQPPPCPVPNKRWQHLSAHIHRVHLASLLSVLQHERDTRFVPLLPNPTTPTESPEIRTPTFPQTDPLLAKSKVTSLSRYGLYQI